MNRIKEKSKCEIKNLNLKVLIKFKPNILLTHLISDSKVLFFQMR